MLGCKGDLLSEVNFMREHGKELCLASPRGGGEELREVLEVGRHV